MLDHSLVLACTEVCDGNTHGHDDMPFVLAGGGRGRIRTGQLFDFGYRRHADLLMTIAQPEEVIATRCSCAARQLIRLRWIGLGSSSPPRIEHARIARRRLAGTPVTSRNIDSNSTDDGRTVCASRSSDHARRSWVTPASGASANAASAVALIAPAEVPTSTPGSVGIPRSRETSSSTYDSTPTS